MQLHQLQREHSQKSQKRVGRGGGRGKTSGRGTKGQKARAGHRIRPDVREQIKKLPKLRGYAMKSIARKVLPVNVGLLEQVFKAGETVTPETLRERGAVRMQKRILSPVKILGSGELNKKLAVSGCAVSASAREKIEKAGGTIV